MLPTYTRWCRINKNMLNIIVKMPQFDIFSFFTQLFWVFLGFTFFYLILTSYLLPSLSVILKIRNRKLKQITVGNKTNSVLKNNTNTVLVSSNGLFSSTSSHVDFMSKFSPTDNKYVTPLSSFHDSLNFYAAKFEKFCVFKTGKLIQIQLAVFLYV